MNKALAVFIVLSMVSLTSATPTHLSIDGVNPASENVAIDNGSSIVITILGDTWSRADDIVMLNDGRAVMSHPVILPAAGSNGYVIDYAFGNQDGTFYDYALGCGGDGVEVGAQFSTTVTAVAADVDYYTFTVNLYNTASFMVTDCITFTVPEPVSQLFLVLGILAVLRRRK